MFSWKNRKAEIILGAVAILLLAVIILKSSPVEGAKGFYIVRPTHWVATPTEISVELTSFYPTTLLCEITAGDVKKSVQLDPRSSVTITVKGHYVPGQYVVLPVEVNCDQVKEKGEIRLFITG